MSEHKNTEYDSIVLAQEIVSFQDFIEHGEQGEYLKASFYVPISLIMVAENIRPKKQDHVNELAVSIKEQGQQQPCVGDIFYDIDSHCWIPRLIAGRHRYEAICKNEREKEKDEPEQRIWITLVNRQYSPHEIIDIQLAENIHERMTSSEEGRILYDYWRNLYELKKNEGEELTLKEFSKRVGRSQDTVRNAIKFVEGLDSRVQELVDKKKLPYTYAVLLVDLPKDGEKFMTTQYEIAEHIYRNKLSFKQVREIIKNKKVELGAFGPLFGDWEKMKVTQYVLGIKNTSGENAKEAGLWFKRVIDSLNRMGDTQRKKLFTTAILNSIETIGLTSKDFFKYLSPYVDAEFLKEFLGNQSN